MPFHRPEDRPVDRRITADLIERHDRPGPRYTSYPTAVEFHEGIDSEQYAARLRRADARRHDPLSLYMHLPFCEERCLFCGCHVIISPDKERARPYLELLEREMELVCGELKHRRRVSQLHLGGGTPTYYDEAQLEQLFTRFHDRFVVLPDAELAIEVDPRVTTEDHVRMLGQWGFNRMSLGVQDFDPKVQEAIGRVQPMEMTRAVMDAGRAHGFGGVSVDLIYGLPHQTVDSFADTVDKVVGLGADRVAIYSFAYVPWIRGHQRKLPEDAFPSAREKIELFTTAREHLLHAGYEPIGMDHFAKPDDELARARREGRLRRNFQGYAVIPADDVIGLGISAIGDIDGMYVQNVKKLSTYRAALEAGQLPVERGLDRTPDDEVRRTVIHELMCNFSVDMQEIGETYDLDFETAFADELARLAPFQEEGLVSLHDGRIEASPTGELFVRNLAMCFDRYLPQHQQGSDGPVFSRTV